MDKEVYEKLVIALEWAEIKAIVKAKDFKDYSRYLKEDTDEYIEEGRLRK